MVTIRVTICYESLPNMTAGVYCMSSPERETEPGVLGRCDSFGTQSLRPFTSSSLLSTPLLNRDRSLRCGDCIGPGCCFRRRHFSLAINHDQSRRTIRHRSPCSRPIHSHDHGIRIRSGCLRECSRQQRTNVIGKCRAPSAGRTAAGARRRSDSSCRHQRRQQCQRHRHQGKGSRCALRRSGRAAE